MDQVLAPITKSEAKEIIEKLKAIDTNSCDAYIDNLQSYLDGKTQEVLAVVKGPYNPNADSCTPIAGPIVKAAVAKDAATTRQTSTREIDLRFDYRDYLSPQERTRRNIRTPRSGSAGRSSGGRPAN